MKFPSSEKLHTSSIVPSYIMHKPIMSAHNLPCELASGFVYKVAQPQLLLSAYIVPSSGVIVCKPFTSCS